MIVYGATRAQLEYAAGEVGAQLYNVRAQGRGIAFVLRPDGSELSERFRKHGYRGRRVWAIDWEGHWYFFDALYRLAPNARVRSVLATYTDREDFYVKAPATQSLHGNWAG